jgi:hypothetical protein
VNPMPRNPLKTRCSVPGCRAWAIRGSDPPLCSPHRSRKDPPGQGVGAPSGNQNRRIHGFYATALPPDEQARLLAPEGITSLDAEIALTRAALDRIYDMLLTGVTPGPNPCPLDAQDYARFIGLAFRGANTVARLLSTRVALGGDPNDAFSVAMDKALDQINAVFGLDL